DGAGDGLRRARIVLGGGAAAPAGSRMIAGTLILCRRCGPLPGYLMARGTIVLGGNCEELSPTFVDCGSHELVAMRLMAAFASPYSTRAASVLGGRLRRLAGDMAVRGKGGPFIQGGGYPGPPSRARRTGGRGSPPDGYGDGAAP